MTGRPNLDAIGSTLLARLERIAPPGAAMIVAKLETLIKKMIATAGLLSQQPGHWWCDQHNNHDAISEYVPLGEEIWRQTAAVLSGRPGGAHRVEGIGIGFLPPLWEPHKVDEIIPVPTAEAQAMARRLARVEAIFAGASSGANVAAAVQVAQRLGPDAVVATIIVDSGMRYISTDLFR